MLAQSPLLRSPVEIQDKIISYTSSDLHTLANICLVCDALLDIGRKHLYQVITVGVAPFPESGPTRVVRDPEIAIALFETLAEYGHIAQFVKKVALSSHPLPFSELVYWDAMNNALRRLGGLQTLFIYRHSRREESCFGVLLQGCTFPMLKHFKWALPHYMMSRDKISSVTYDNLSDMIAFLLQHSRIEDLSIFLPSLASHSESQELLPNLTRLQCDTASAAEILKACPKSLLGIQLSLFTGKEESRMGVVGLEILYRRILRHGCQVGVQSLILGGGRFPRPLLNYFLLGWGPRESFGSLEVLHLVGRPTHEDGTREVSVCLHFLFSAEA